MLTVFHWPTVRVWSETHFNFHVLLQGPGTPKAVLANQNEAQQYFHRQLFHYAENFLHEMLNNIHRINIPTPIGRAKIRPLPCCVISLAQYINK